MGKARLEAVAIILCAAIMAMAAGEILQQCVLKLANTGVRGEGPAELTSITLGLLVGVVVVELTMFVVCYSQRHVSGSVRAVAFDHVADAASNTAALVSAALSSSPRARAWFGPGVALADPIGGIAIALVVIAGWGNITWEHVTKLIGRGASAELVQRVEAMADSHHPLLQRDSLRCYHAGEGVLVELEARMDNYPYSHP